MARERGLGKGIDAIFEENIMESDGGVVTLRLSEIKPNHEQPRKYFDQQGLIALIAPRPVYVASATLDDWADPEGEFLSAVAASPVYELYGLTGLTGKKMPKPDSPIQGGHVAYHLRTGKHDINSYDWEQYIKFANFHFSK